MIDLELPKEKTFFLLEFGEEKLNIIIKYSKNYQLFFLDGE